MRVCARAPAAVRVPWPSARHARLHCAAHAPPIALRPPCNRCLPSACPLRLLPVALLPLLLRPPNTAAATACHRYVEKLELILDQKMEKILDLKNKLGRFKEHLKEEEQMSKTIGPASARKW